MECYLLTLLSLFLLCSVTSPIQIEVDWQTGRNTNSCGILGFNSCKTISYALEGVRNNTQLMLGSGHQYINGTVSVSNLNNLTIVGHFDNTTIDCGDEYSGFSFISTTYIRLENIVFDNCGFSLGNNSTKVKKNDKSVIFFLASSYIFLYLIQFANSIGSALVIHNTIDVEISGCIFDNNSFNGLQIEFSGTNDNRSSHYLIQNCSFYRNGIFSMSRGAGVSILLRDDVLSKEFEITLCRFRNNNATYGGAIALQFHDNSSHNSISVRDSCLAHNNAIKEGGAVQIFIRSWSSIHNSIIFDNVTFLENVASIGGGVLIKSISTVSGRNYITFCSCIWSNNHAEVAGAAMTLYPIYFREEEQDYLIGFSVIPVINNSIFLSNAIDHHNQNSGTGIGIIYSESISLNISGNVKFDSNTGSPIYISSANIHVHKDSTLEFHNNLAIKGGGVALMHGSYLTAHENTTILFVRNIVSESGGGIFSDLSNYIDYLHFRHCFLRYYDTSIHPKEWNTHFKFTNNSAKGLGQDIYAASLKPCCNIYNITNPIDLIKHHPFVFDTNHSKVGTTVSTDPDEISPTENCSNSSIQVYPGIKKILPIKTMDELSHTVTPILLATYDCGKARGCPFHAEQQFIANYIYSIVLNKPRNKPKFNTTFSLRLSTISTREIGISIIIHITNCPIGYYLHKGKCVCSNLVLPGIVSCNTSSEQTITVKVGYWFGCKNGDASQLLAGNCPPGYCSYRGQANSLFEIEQECTTLKNLSCSNHRTGRLCGDCIDNYSVLYHSDRFRCYKCKHTFGIFLYFLSELLPLTILFCVIILFDISLTSGPLSSFVFFAQVLDIFEVTAYGSYTLPNPMKQISHLYRFIFGFFNLDFFRLDAISFVFLQKLLLLIYWLLSMSLRCMDLP